MKKIHIEMIIDAVKDMCGKANYHLGKDVLDALMNAQTKETSETGRSIINDLLLNASIASSKEVPMCQDTGMVVVFVNIGREVYIEGGSLNEAIQEGIRQGYKENYLRKSVVSDPLLRDNSGDNTPGVIHYDFVEGNQLEITIAPKGFGSENMSQMKMLKPSEGVEGVKKFVLDVVEQAGPNPCPPIIVGVGIGGTIEKAALIAKRALMRPLNDPHPSKHIQDIENELLSLINKTGIGPQGLGGLTTALGVHIETFPTHIAGLPVVVNINCHASRHLTRIL
jgi:fumarate hydratase subunit alpha